MPLPADVGFESPDELAPFDSDPPDADSVRPPSALDADALELEPGFRVAARSFFAQPEPLNTIAGGAKPFLSVPSAPHSGQNGGTGSWIPWRMSVFCPQFEQLYS